MADLALGDPNATTQRVFELALADEEMSVASFSTAAELLGHLERKPVDIVFLNVTLGEDDGYRVCRQIKTNRATARIPVVLLLGAFQALDEERARNAGCRAHLFKPFETSQLSALVRDILANPEPESINLLPEGCLFKLPVGRPVGEPVFKLPEDGRRPVFQTLEREIAAPPAPDLRPAPPAPEPPKEDPEAVAAAAAASREKDFERIVEKLAERLPQELRRMLPEVVRDLSSTKD